MLKQLIWIGSSRTDLHAFQKKSKKSIKTPREDINLITQRLKTAIRISRGEL